MLRFTLPYPDPALKRFIWCGAGVDRLEPIESVSALLDRITIDQEICGGRPCIKGTRFWVSLLLDLLAGGMTEAELRSECPQLAREDVLAALAYGADASR